MVDRETRTSTFIDWIRTVLPICHWLPSYQRSWLRADIGAGLAVWAMTVPQALAYAGIAGVPPVYGLYAVPIAMAAYAVLGSSRTLCVGPESAIAIISAATVGALATQNAAEFLALTTLTAFIAGVLFLVFGLLRLGWVADFLSKPVQQGFIHGIALTVIVGQLPAVLGTEAATAEIVKNLKNLPQLVGLDIGYNGVLVNLWAVAQSVPQANLVTFLIGLLSLVLLFALRSFVPLAPSALIAVVLSVVAVAGLGLETQGVRIVGEVETGMVSLTWPTITMQRVLDLLPGAFAIVLLGYSASLGIAAVGAQKTGETIDPNQELVGLGVANLGAAFSSGFVVCGSLSRGSVILRAGGRTQIVSLVNAGLVILTLAFALPLFFKLPNATLSAVVIQAMVGLLSLAYFRQLLRVSKAEFGYAAAALLGVLLLGILEGVAIGVVLSLAILIRDVSRPATAILGRLPGTQTYRDTRQYPDAETIPGLLIFGFNAPLIFANASFFGNRVRQLVGDAERPVREVMVSTRQINQLDSTGADLLAKLHLELQAKGIALTFADVRHALRETMRRTGLEDLIGNERFHESIDAGVAAFLTGGGSTSD